MNDMLLRGSTAVITGAGSGIGRGIASALARRGCNLALADVNASGLEQTATLLSDAGVRVSTHNADVADRASVASLPDAVMAQHPGVDLLINNAGVAIGGRFEQVSEADFEWLFEINFWGVVRMTRAFLPLLRQSRDARITNLSSVWGLLAPAGQVPYSASKFAVRGFSEALRHELANTHIGVSVVHPGGVSTAIADSARHPADLPAEEVKRRRAAVNRQLRMPPERAGEIIVRGIERRKSRILVGSDARAIAVMARLVPVSYWKLLGPRVSSRRE